MEGEGDLAGLLAERLEDPVLVLDAGGRPVFSSRAFRERLSAGERDRELPALFRRVHGEDRRRVLDALRGQDGEISRVRFRVRAAGGGWRRLELRVERGADAQLVRLVDVVLPAADSGSDAGSLEEIAAHLDLAFWLVEIPGGRVRYVSPGFESVWGRPRGDLLRGAEAFFAAVHPEDRERLRKLAHSAWRTGFQEEFRSLLPGGEERWLQHRCVALRGPDGAVRAVLSITRNVDEQRAAESARRRSDERLRVVAHSAFSTITEIDEGGSVTWVGPRDWDEPFRPPDEPRQPRPDLIHPEDRERAVRKIGEAVRDERSLCIEYRVEWPERGVRWIETTVGPYRTPRGERRALMMSRDVSDRRATLEALRESEERYRQLVELSPEGIVVHADGVILYVNPAGARLAGATPEELIGTPVLGLMEPESLGPVVESLRRYASGESGPESHEFRLRRRDGEVRDVIGSGTRVSYRGRPAIQGVVQDITEWRRAERERERLQLQLQEAHKLESLGVLAGGIAHDFNNLLAVILGNARFALRHGPVPEDSETALGDVVDAAESASRLTRQLLVYAGRRAPDVRALDLSQQTRAVSELLETAVPRQVRLELALADGLPSVHADVVQLEQVTMNLLFNACEAIGEGPGEVRIATGHTRVGAGDIAGWIGAEELEPGEFAFLEVRDTGCGMDEERRARIFDPFFTTKSVGHGLGLSAALGFVRAHGGGIEIASRPGEGTSMRLYLPSSPDPAAAAGRPER